MRSGWMIPVAGILLLLSLGACSDDDPTGPVISEPITATLADTVGTGGGAVEVEGLDPARVDLDELEFTIGGRRAYVASNASGEVRLLVPPLLDEDAKSFVDSDGRLDVEARDATGEVVLSLPQALAIRAPEPAPGAAADALESMDRFIGALGEVLAALPTDDALQEQALVSLVPALRSMTAVDGELAISAHLDSLSSDQTAMLDALWSAAGVPDDLAVLAEAAEGMAAKMARRPDKSTALDDAELAALMQFSVFAKRYGEWYLHGVAGDTELAATTAGVLMLFVEATPGLGQLFGLANFLVSFTDFIVNKHLVALLPTQIDDLSLSMNRTYIAVGGTTQSTKSILVSNNPPAVTLNDFIGQLLNAAGILTPAEIGPVRDILRDIAMLLVAEINNFLASFAQGHPDLLLPVDVYTVPDISWTATLNDPRLFDVRTARTDLLEPDAELGEWTAGNNDGEGNVWIEPSRDSDAILFDFEFLQYNAGAFGEDIVSSNQVTVHVSAPLRIEVDFADVISRSGMNVLGAVVSRVDAQGQATPAEGLGVWVQVEGGSADPHNGTTDESGSFQSLISADSFADTVFVRVGATDSLATTAEARVAAVVISEGGAYLMGGEMVLNGNYSINVGDPAYLLARGSGSRFLQHDVFRGACDTTVVFDETAVQAETGITATVQLQSSLEASWQFNQDGTLASITSVFAGHAAVGHTGSVANNYVLAGATGIADFQIQVRDAPQRFSLVASFQGTPGKVDFMGLYTHTREEGEIGSLVQLEGELQPGDYNVWVDRQNVYANSGYDPPLLGDEGGFSFLLTFE